MCKSTPNRVERYIERNAEQINGREGETSASIRRCPSIGQCLSENGKH